MQPEELVRQLLQRPVNSHKYQFGHVLVIGGSPGMVGAPYLAGRAALRSGAGLVTIGSTPEVIDKLEARTEEIMTFRLAPNRKVMLQELERFIHARKVDVLVIGSGMMPELADQTAAILSIVGLPTVIDAGGLAALYAKRKVNLASQHLVLTPHPGEFQRFFHDHLPKDREALRPIAQEFAHSRGVTLVLKGQPTFVANQEGELYVNSTGGPALATAGTGDVLSGVIAACLAQGLSPYLAAQSGVYLHGFAGDVAGRTKSVAGVIASDVIESLPVVLRHLAQQPAKPQL